MDVNERNDLINAGWKDEGTGWYSDEHKSVPLYREYNPNAVTGTHNYTTDKAEHDKLVSLGWRDEGIGWYGITPSDSKYKPGDIVLLGSYEQDNDLSNGAEPIEWQVLKTGTHSSFQNIFLITRVIMKSKGISPGRTARYGHGSIMISTIPHSQPPARKGF